MNLIALIETLANKFNIELVSKETLQLTKTFSENKTETQTRCYKTRS